MSGLFAHSDPSQLLLYVTLSLFFLGGLGLFWWGSRRANQQREKQQKHYIDNVERHRVHAERAERHMGQVESLLERIAVALERKVPEQE